MTDVEAVKESNEKINENANHTISISVPIDLLDEFEAWRKTLPYTPSRSKAFKHLLMQYLKIYEALEQFDRWRLMQTPSLSLEEAFLNMVNDHLNKKPLEKDSEPLVVEQNEYPQTSGRKSSKAKAATALTT